MADYEQAHEWLVSGAASLGDDLTAVLPLEDGPEQFARLAEGPPAGVQGLPGRRGARVMSRVALVVGASSGIGLATAQQLRDAGYTVHAAARREIPLDGVTAHRLDVTDRAAVDALAGELGALDVLVVAAGTNIKERRLERAHAARRWETSCWARTSTGPFNLLHAFLPALREARGDVVVIASVSGRWPDRSGPGLPGRQGGGDRADARRGLRELDGEVRFTAILPGVVDTPILENRPEPPSPEIRAQMLQRRGRGRRRAVRRLAAPARLRARADDPSHGAAGHRQDSVGAWTATGSTTGCGRCG